LVEDFDAGLHVIGGWVNVLDLPAEEFGAARLLAVLADDAYGVCCGDLDVFVDDPCAFEAGSDDARDAVFERGGGTGSPKIVGLGDVGVDIDDGEACGRGGCGHGVTSGLLGARHAVQLSKDE